MSSEAKVNRADRAFTTKQMGDACEMLVAAELTLAGIPALKVPDNWPHYELIAEGAVHVVKIGSITVIPVAQLKALIGEG